MGTYFTFAVNLGLRHVLEDTLSFLGGEKLSKERGDFVLSYLSHLFEKAIRGSVIANDQTLFVGNNDAEAFEKFTLVNKYYQGQDASSFMQSLKPALDILNSVKNSSAALTEENRKLLQDFLSALLESIRQEENFSRQSEPEIIDLLNLR